MIAILLLAGAMIVGTLFYIVVNYSEVNREFSCEGETTLVDGGAAEADKGRLQISTYRWWVSLWSEQTDGNAVFQSTKFGSFWEGKLDISGDGNFSTNVGLTTGKSLVFQLATGELGVREAGRTFTGDCRPAS